MLRFTLLGMLLLAGCKAAPQPSLDRARRAAAAHDWTAALGELDRYFAGRSPRSAEALHLYARVLRGAGRLQQAIRVYSEILDRDGADIEARQERARALFEAGRYKRASIDLAGVILLGKADDSTYVLLARALLKDDPPQPKRALRYLREAAGKGLKDPSAFELLGDLCFQEQSWAEAARAYEQSVRLQERPAVWVKLGRVRIILKNHALALEAFQRALALDPDHAEACFFRGTVLYFTGRDRGAAVRDIDRGIRLGYRTPNSFMMRAYCMRDAMEFDRAIADATAALELDPRLLAALHLRAELYLDTLRPEKAAADARAALRIDPESVRMHEILARAAVLLRDYPTALEALQEAVRLNPSGAGLHAQRGAVLERLNRLSGAEQAYTQAIQLKPEQLRYRLDRARVRFALRDYRNVLADTEQVLAVFPGNVEARVLDARARLRLGDFEAAVRGLRRALQAEPGRSDVRLLLARAEFDRGHLDAALAEAAKLSKGSREAALLEARALAGLGRRKDALERLDRALKRWKNDGGLYLLRGSLRLEAEHPGARADLEKALDLLPEKRDEIRRLLRRARD